MKTIIFLAPPAAGKGTQADLLKQECGYAHVAIGDILREVSNQEDELGEYVRETLSSGGFVKEEIVYRLIEERLLELSHEQGVILDGFPRYIEQAHKLDEIMIHLKRKIDFVILFDIDKEILQKRITGRRICKDCGSIYNINVEAQSPKVESICDKCHGKLYQRSDDNMESFEVRYQNYLEKTCPLIDFYQQKGLLHIVNANRNKEQISKDVINIVTGKSDKND